MRQQELARFAIDMAHRIARNEPFRKDLTDSLVDLLVSDAGAALSEVQFRPSLTWTATTSGAPPFHSSREQRAKEWAPRHPGIRTFQQVGVARPVRVSDLVTLRRFWGTPPFEAIHGPEGGRYPAGAPVLLSADRLVFLGVQRHTRDFSDDDMRELAELQRLLAAAFEFRAALDRAVARLEPVFDPRPTPGQQNERPAMFDCDSTYRPTRREAEVLTLAASGWTNQRIGARLGISERTVRKHLSAVYQKSLSSGRTEAVAWWQRRQLAV